MEEHYLALIRGDRRGPWPALERLGLRILSLGYGWAARLRNWLFDRAWKKSYGVSIPLISVGNLTLGGTGKTPCVEYVARFYRQLDRRVALLSRGYGASAGRNDEAMVLEENLPDVPHLQGLDRVALAQVALEELDSEILVLDDGFQHRRLRRDLDLVLVDATVPWGYGHLFPRGLLREPTSSLRRADVVILTRCDLVQSKTVVELRRQIGRRAPGVAVVETRHRPSGWINSRQSVKPLDALKQVAGFCGIGNPEAFRRTLGSLGLAPVDWRVFPDHHGYTRADVESLRTWAKQLPGGTALVTTQKDLVKIRLDRLGERELWALQIELQIVQGKDVLEGKLHQLVRC